MPLQHLACYAYDGAITANTEGTTMANYRVGSESAEATERHFAAKRKELREARIRALDAAHHGEQKVCRTHGTELNEYWECDCCEAQRAEESMILSDGRAF